MPRIWLASYPKSGSTWVRAWLQNYLLPLGRPATLHEITHSSFVIGPKTPLPPGDGVVFTKTHDRYAPAVHGSDPVIYIHRRREAVIKSAAKHWGMSEAAARAQVEYGRPLHIKSWFKANLALTIGYEDLPDGFGALADYLEETCGIAGDIYKAARNSHIDVLRADEAANGFAEKSQYQERFFGSRLNKEEAGIE